MLPGIAVMIGAYIMARMFQQIFPVTPIYRKGAYILNAALSLCVIVVTVLMLFDIIAAGSR